MPEVGKISGQMLEDNLERDGIDLSFDSDLLYLDVNNRRIGANSTTPYSDFLVNNTLKTDNLIVDNQFNIADFTFYGNTIQNVTGPINLDSADNLVYAKAWATSSGLQVTGNDIKTTNTNQAINFYPSGSGRTVFDKNVLVNGNLHATGDITFDGDLIFGDSDSDNVNFKSDIASDIRPDATDTYSLGSISPTEKRWNNTWTNNTAIDSYNSTSSIIANNIDLTLPQGKTWYVDKNGLDTNVGNHQSGPFASLVKALSVAQLGDTIMINPGTYQEVCPMIVPVGVTIKGLNIRTVIIAPTSGTRNKDIFLLNGETTVEDLTVTGFEYDAVNNTGYAFRFANNFKITSRSPYIKNISVITQGSSVRLGTAPSDDPQGFLAGDAGRGALVDGASASLDSRDASMLFTSVTFIVPGVEGIAVTNGARIEWINCFTYYASKGINLTRGLTGFTTYGGSPQAGGVTVGPAPVGISWTSNSVSLPKSSYSQLFVNSLVGKQAVFDRYPSAPVFYTIVSVATETNDPTQWRMTFAETFNPILQFRNVSFYDNVGLTYIVTNNIWDTTGNSIGEKWVAWFKYNLPPDFNTTVGPNWTINVAGTLYVVDYIIQDPVNSNQWRIYVTTSLVAGTGIPIFSSPVPGTVTKFGAELRSINSANVYGTYGAVADGADTLGYLIGHNFGYIGSGRFSNNDPTLVIETNEVVMDNGGKIYYQSTDQSGNVRVGTVFKINGETGAVSFVSNSLTLGGTSSISLQNGPNLTYIDPTEVTTGNIRFSGNTISSLSNNIIFSPLSGNLIFNANNLTIPKATDAELTLSTVGEVKFDTNFNAFEGYGTNGQLNLYAIGDSTRTTRLVAETTPGANDQVIKAWANNDLKFSADTTKVFFKSLDLGSLSFNKFPGYDGRLRLAGNDDLTLLPSNDITSIKNLEFTTDSITNTSVDAILTLNSTNTGYWKFGGQALVVPFGDNSLRPAVLEVGMQRYNTEAGYLEAWDGTAWVNASGATNVTINDMGEIADFWALVVG